MTQDQFNALTEGTVVRIIATGKTYARTDKGTFYPFANGARVAGSKTTKLTADKVELATDALVTQVVETPVVAEVVEVAKAAPTLADTHPQARGATPTVLAYLRSNPQAYKLSGSDRVELITAATARIRNTHRGDAKRWVLDETIDPNTLEIPGHFRYSPEERRTLWLKGLEADRVFNEQMIAAKNAQAAADKGDTETPGAEAKPKVSKGGGKARQTWDGLPPTGVIRTLASMGWEKATIGKLMTTLALVVSDTTLNIQFNDGAKKKFGHGPALTLTADQISKLREAAGMTAAKKNVATKA